MSGLADLSLDEVIRLTSGSKPGRKQRGPRQGISISFSLDITICAPVRKINF